MKLHEYLNQRDTPSEEEFAAKCCVSVSCVRKWRYGERFPRRTHLERIMKHTSGQVTANDFTPVAEVA
jgi:DNA-binding transcriptional regulator YiaG